MKMRSNLRTNGTGGETLRRSDRRPGPGRRGTARIAALALLMLATAMTACILTEYPESDAATYKVDVGPIDGSGQYSGSVDVYFRGYGTTSFSLLVEGTGPMADFGAPGTDSQAPWYGTLFDGAVTDTSGTAKYIFSNESVTHIGDYAFSHCTGGFTVSGDLKSIGEQAFSYSSIESWDFGDCTDMVLGKDIFKGCTNLQTIKFGSGFSTKDGQSIADADLTDHKFVKYSDGAYVEITANEDFVGHTFIYDSGRNAYVRDTSIPHEWNIGPLESGVFTDTVKAVLIEGKLTVTGSGPMADFGYVRSDYWAPWNDEDLADEITSVVIGDGVTTIGGYCFFDCSNLEDVSIGGSVGSIGDGAFYLTEALTGITIPQSVKGFGDACFDASGLRSFDFGNLTGVTLGTEMFKGCSDLATISFGRGFSVADGQYIPDLWIADQRFVYDDYTDIETNEGFIGHTFTLDTEEGVYVSDGGLTRSHSVTYMLYDDPASVWKVQEVGEGDWFLIPEDILYFDTALSGWTDGAETYAPGQRVMMGTDDIVLTAVWFPVREVRYDDGSGEISSAFITDGRTEFTVDEADPVKEGFAFGGWLSGGMVYHRGDSVPLDTGSAVTVLTAVWTEVEEPSPTVPPIIPGGDASDGDLPVVIVPEDGEEPRSGKDGKIVLMTAVIAAIVGELAVLAFSRRH